MVVLDWLGAVAAVLLLLLAAVAVRRRVLGRAGATLDVSLRLRRGTHGRGWALGAARYRIDELQWYRVFSLAPRPARVLPRGQLAVRGQRVPAVPESLMLQAGSVVLDCTGPDGPVEIAMTEGAVTGFLSWLQAAPGTGMPSGAPVSSRRLAARARRRRG